MKKTKGQPFFGAFRHNKFVQKIDDDFLEDTPGRYDNGRYGRVDAVALTEKLKEGQGAEDNRYVAGAGAFTGQIAEELYEPVAEESFPKNNTYDGRQRCRQDDGHWQAREKV
jgi:hypothetical protein